MAARLSFSTGPAIGGGRDSQPPHRERVTTQPPKPPSMSMFEMLLAAAANAAMAKAEAERPPWPMNPFPTGIRSGSATDCVLAELRRAYPQHLEHGQLRFNLGASRGMVTWALRYAESHGLVERVHDPRHPRYCRWRITQKGLTNDRD